MCFLKMLEASCQSRKRTGVCLKRLHKYRQLYIKICFAAQLRSIPTSWSDARDWNGVAVKPVPAAAATGRSRGQGRGKTRGGDLTTVTTNLKVCLLKRQGESSRKI